MAIIIPLMIRIISLVVIHSVPNPLHVISSLSSSHHLGIRIPENSAPVCSPPGLVCLLAMTTASTHSRVTPGCLLLDPSFSPVVSLTPVLSRGWDFAMPSTRLGAQWLLHEYIGNQWGDSHVSLHARDTLLTAYFSGIIINSSSFHSKNGPSFGWWIYYIWSSRKNIWGANHLLPCQPRVTTQNTICYNSFLPIVHF